MLVNTAIEPPPPVRRRVARIRHVGARVEAPRRALLAADLVAVAEQRPDGVRPVCVALVVLLRDHQRCFWRNLYSVDGLSIISQTTKYSLCTSNRSRRTWSSDPRRPRTPDRTCTPAAQSPLRSPTSWAGRAPEALSDCRGSPSCRDRHHLEECRSGGKQKQQALSRWRRARTGDAFRRQQRWIWGREANVHLAARAGMMRLYMVL